ncbi:MAG: PilZ domain-containing protein [Burkholderiales bacterium]|nr:PilZ domain-containing protein [Burkholderiales bacterium]MDE1927472.1 PilZ domain-containing protein [Burkholderiales bacterium]MDE2158123.1 PilZ domain-containing protein [Burkholderiales bacterium]MDE2501965.1 PilZ domain-containing protein [Burkholderiales bacterium]
MNFKPEPIGGAERRREPRRIFHGKVLLRLGDGQQLETRGIDLSASGIGVECPVNLVPAASCELRLSLMLKDGSIHPVTLRGSIAYAMLSGKYGAFHVGIQFAGSAREDSDILARYLAP